MTTTTQTAAMADVAARAAAMLEHSRIPYLRIVAEDSPCSSVSIRGSLDEPRDWPDGCFHRSRGFLIRIYPADGARYWREGSDRATVRLSCAHPSMGRFRGATMTLDGCLLAMREWLETRR